jgi:hypothetical protein
MTYNGPSRALRGLNPDAVIEAFQFAEYQPEMYQTFCRATSSVAEVV